MVQRCDAAVSVCRRRRHQTACRTGMSLQVCCWPCCTLGGLLGHQPEHPSRLVVAAGPPAEGCPRWPCCAMGGAGQLIGSAAQCCGVLGLAGCSRQAQAQAQGALLLLSRVLLRLVGRAVRQAAVLLAVPQAELLAAAQGVTWLGQPGAVAVLLAAQ